MTGDLPEIDLGAKRLFEIVRIEHGVAGRDRDPHRHRYYELIWVESGGGTHAVDFIDCPIAPDRLHVIAPNQVHQWHDNDFRGWMLLFGQALLDRDATGRLKFGSGLYMRPDAPPEVALDEATGADVRPLWDLLQRERRTEPPDWHQIRPLLAALMAAVARIARRQNGLGLYRYAERIEALLKLVDRHFLEHRSTAFYAAELGISAKRLNQIARQVMGRTVLQ
ncbi:MAG: AraC family ligand binding domain-containing protein, partial [Hyphomicrobiales bacterium]